MHKNISQALKNFQKLKEISSKKSIQSFYEANLETINFYNEQFLSETSKKDRVFYKGNSW